MTFSRRAGQSESPGSAGPGRRTRRLFKLALSVVALGALVSVALRVAAPHLISSAVVRSAIESSMAQWAGHPVTIEDVSELRFWPQPEVTLEGVTIRRASDRPDEPFVEIQRLSAEFSLLSAVKGKPDFNDFRFERPQIRIQRDIDGRLDWSGDGLLNTAVRGALTTQTSPESDSGTRETEIGTVEIINGAITLIDAQSGTTIVADRINAKIDWPRLAAPLSGQATFNVQDRGMSLSLQTPTPLLLLAGAASQVDLSASLPGMRGRLQGVIDLNQASLEQADVNLSISDMPQAASAIGVRLAGTERWQTASLTAQVTDAEDEWRFDNLEFKINGSPGDGILTLKKRAGAKPLLIGTVAVDLLDLDGFLQALSIDLGDRANVRLPSLTQWVDFDMRMSAATASVANFQLANLGASLTGGDESLKLVIGDTRFLGGTLSARLSASGYGLDQGAEVAVMMDRVDLGSLMSSLAPGSLTLKGIGSLTLNAKLAGPGWRRNIDAMSGRLDIRADNGEILGLNAVRLREMSSDRAYFQLSAAGAGKFDYRSLDISLRFSEGSAEVEKSRIVGTQETFTLSGIIPYSRQALALTGELSPTETADQAGSPLRFFIGGAWQDPVISPIPPVPAAGQ
ncbi:MAG: AsmA family protein [Rhizobium rhizophilum]